MYFVAYDILQIKYNTRCECQVYYWGRTTHDIFASAFYQTIVVWLGLHVDDTFVR